ncbi:protein Dok-7-like [Sycon ciliatum]|uniref:protein Dok-7-like n=1 Tax=Sycon ciliatum TaxID=27933 RepID=UPI0031F70F08
MAGDPLRIVLESSVWVWDREDDTGPKTWHARWCSVTKSPGQSRIRIRLSRNGQNLPLDAHGHEVPMENFAGVEVFPGPYEGQSHCFSLITFYRTYCIALASMDALRTWVDCIANELGHEWKFDVRVLATQNIVPAGDAIMRFYPRFFSLTNGSPPVCLGLWQHNHLRRYGGSQGFSFESGSRSIGGPEVYRLATHQGASIKELFDCVAHGRQLPEPPVAMRRTYSTSSNYAAGADTDSDTWSVSPGASMSGRPMPPSNNPFAFSNDTISMCSGIYSATDELGQPQQSQQQQQASPSAQSTRGRDGEYDYVSVDVPRRPAAADRDVNYLSVKVGGGTSTTTTPQTNETSSPASNSPSNVATSTIYSGVDIQKTTRLRDALVQSHRH